MTDTNVFGTALSLPTIERAVMAHLRRWFPDYLRDAERREGVRADGVTPLEPGELPLPRSWRPAAEVDKWAEDQLPAIIFGSPGLSDSGPRRSGDGKHEGPWVFSLTAVVSGRDDQVNRWLVGIYTAALRLLLMQQPMIVGLPVEGCHYADEAYDPIPQRRSRALMAGTVVYELVLSGLGDAAAGPLAPAENPIPDPGPYPEVENTGLDVTRSAPL